MVNTISQFCKHPFVRIFIALCFIIIAAGYFYNGKSITAIVCAGYASALIETAMLYRRKK